MKIILEFLKSYGLLSIMDIIITIIVAMMNVYVAISAVAICICFAYYMSFYQEPERFGFITIAIRLFIFFAIPAIVIAYFFAI